MRLPKGEYLIVVAERECESAIADHAKRWEVETLFGCLKSRGFCLEQTHVTDPDRLKKLLALLALALRLGARRGRMVERTAAADNQEAWASGAKLVSAWLGSSATHIMQPAMQS